jgi:hypothetical protein
VEADVVPAGSAEGDVPMTTFDGLKYDIRQVGVRTLAESADAADPFDVRIQIAAYPLNDLASVTIVRNDA